MNLNYHHWNTWDLSGENSGSVLRQFVLLSWLSELAPKKKFSQVFCSQVPKKSHKCFNVFATQFTLSVTAVRPKYVHMTGTSCSEVPAGDQQK